MLYCYSISINKLQSNALHNMYRVSSVMPSRRHASKLLIVCADNPLTLAMSVCLMFLSNI